MHVRPIARQWFFTAAAALLCSLPMAAVAQMHKVSKPDQVTRAVGVYEYIGDPQKPKAARFIPVSLFIGGHFEDAGIYLARPIPFALDTGLRYELQKGGVPQDVLDLIASRNFAGSAVAANLPFDDGWFGYGHVSQPRPEKAGRIRHNCGNAHVVQEAPKDDGKPHFGSRPADPKPVDPKAAAAAIPEDCRDEDMPEKITLDEDSGGKKDKDAADPDRPTLHRSPESTAHNTGTQGKTGKKDAKKPPEATVTQNSTPAEDPDRPVIRHRTVDEDDPNALPPDPIELAGRSPARPASPAAATAPGDARAASNETVAEGGSITSGNTMGGGPTLRRGKPAAAATDAVQPVDVQPVVNAVAFTAPMVPAPLDAMVAVSDAKERPLHDFSYKLSSGTERAAALGNLEDLAKAVVLNPSLATDAPDGTQPLAPAPAPRPSPVIRRGAHGARSRATTPPPPPQVSFADEEMSAYQLYFSAPVSYTFFARVPATVSQPERFVTVVANTDPDGTLHPALRTVTDAMHLDRVPRYRPIDAVDADGSNRASLLVELRSQRSRQFALYRLLGNKTDQIFVSGSTLL